jgi:drug/metabolite transporter (DMT)-like permease
MSRTGSHHTHLLVPTLACLLAALLFGASTPIAKVLLELVGPFTLAGLLNLGGALGVLPFAFRGGSPELRRIPRQKRLLMLAVLFGGGLGPVLLLFGLRAAPAASVSLWLNVETVATVILAWAFFKEHLDRRTVMAAGLVRSSGPWCTGIRTCTCW